MRRRERDRISRSGVAGVTGRKKVEEFQRMELLLSSAGGASQPSTNLSQCGFTVSRRGQEEFTDLTSDLLTVQTQVSST